MANEKVPRVRATGKGKRWWHKLSEADKKKHTFWRFEAGHSNSKVMEDLGLSVGTISGIKRRWSESKTAQQLPLPPTPPAPDRPIPDLPTTDTELYPEPVAKEPASLRFATSEKAQCDHFIEEDRKCGYIGTEAKITGTYCTLHAHLHA